MVDNYKDEGRKMGVKNILLKSDVFYFVYNTFSSNRKKIIGRNNTIIKNKVMLSNVKISISGNNNKVSISKGTRLANCEITIYGNGHELLISDDCRLKNTEFWFEDSECSIQIGKNTTIEGAHIAAAESQSFVKIGADCMFSKGINISTTDSHSIIDIESGDRINKAGNIDIGNHVWLGAYSKILKGVNILDNSVVGIGSVVTGDVPSNSVAAGVPAKVVRKNVNWLRERI